MKSAVLLLATLLLIRPVTLPAADKFPEPLGVAGNLAFVTGAFMKETLQADHKLPPPDWQIQSGAVSLNAKWEADKSLPWFIEHQRAGGDWVAAGLAFGNQDAVRWGLKVLEWGFGRMDPDGMFNHHDCYHSASFFVESTAHALLLIEASSLRGEFADQVNALKPKLLTAARWMVRPDVDDLVWLGKKPANNPLPISQPEIVYGHRRYLDAAALGETGLLCDDKTLIERSVALIRNGIAFQRADGVNPEKGGPDTSYQGIGLYYACRYYQVVADDTLRAEMKPMFDKAYGWLLPRIHPDGIVDDTGNTRTGPGGEMTRNGKPKTVDYGFMTECLAHWAQIAGNPELENIARRVFEASRRLKPH